MVPNTSQEAMRPSQAKQWKAASDKENESLRSNGIFMLMSITAIPAGMTAIGSRWVYKVNDDSTHEERPVVQGRGQVRGIDCGA